VYGSEGASQIQHKQRDVLTHLHCHSLCAQPSHLSALEELTEPAEEAFAELPLQPHDLKASQAAVSQYRNGAVRLYFFPNEFQFTETNYSRSRLYQRSSMMGQTS